MAIGNETVDEYAEELAREDDDLDVLAGKIVERLSASVIPSSLPAYIGQQLREAAKGGGYLWTYTVPLAYGYCLSVDIRVNPDGTINLEFRDACGHTFWRGTFRPEET